MININLLPQEMRKKEGMPVPLFAGIMGVFVLVAAVGYLIFDYDSNIIPSLATQRSNLQKQLKDLQAKSADLKNINAEITKYTGFVDSVKTLYRGRTVWSKILSDLKNIANMDPSMNDYNSDMRYLWFSKLTGSDKNISLTGFATASSQNTAIQLTERLLKDFQEYSPVKMPEKDEEERLQERLRAAMIEYENLRRENPSLPLQSPEEKELRQRLEDIKKVKSGGVAMMPFSRMLEPGSVRLVNTTWTGAPRPRTKSDEVFPQQAWSFSITMTLK